MERKKAEEKRQKALEFAKNVPRPKSFSARADGGASEKAGKAGRPRSSEGLAGGYGDGIGDDFGTGAGARAGGGTAVRMSAVEALEAKHLNLRSQVDAIRREFGV